MDHLDIHDIAPDEPEPCPVCEESAGFYPCTRDGAPGWVCAECGAWSAVEIDWELVPISPSAVEAARGLLA